MTDGKDAAASLYMYDSPPGHALATLRSLGGIYAAISALAQKAHFRAKRDFYAAFFRVGTAWALAVPIVLAVAACLPQADRLKASRSLEPACLLLVRGPGRRKPARRVP